VHSGASKRVVAGASATGRAAVLAMLRRLSGSCGKKGKAIFLQGVAELGRRHPDHPSEHLSKMARVRVADFQRDLNEAARGFADELLRVQHARAGHELMRRHARGLLEHSGKVEG